MYVWYFIFSSFIKRYSPLSHLCWRHMKKTDFRNEWLCISRRLSPKLAIPSVEFLFDWIQFSNERKNLRYHPVHFIFIAFTIRWQLQNRLIYFYFIFAYQLLSEELAIANKLKVHGIDTQPIWNICKKKGLLWLLRNDKKPKEIT